jgi:hypothetical protein
LLFPFLHVVFGIGYELIPFLNFLLFFLYIKFGLINDIILLTDGSIFLLNNFISFIQLLFQIITCTFQILDLDFQLTNHDVQRLLGLLEVLDFLLGIKELFFHGVEFEVFFFLVGGLEMVELELNLLEKLLLLAKSLLEHGVFLLVVFGSLL